MPIDYERLLDWKIPDARQSYGLRDTMFYALSVGLGADPLDAGQGRYVYEKALVALPSMVTALAAPGGWLRDPGTGVTSVGLLAAEQSFEIHRALPVSGTVTGTSRVIEVADLELMRKLGHPQPTLHGLYMMGVACHGLLRELCGYDAAELRGMGVRFSALGYVGETLRTEMWREGGEVLFQCRAVERDKIVLSNGRASLV